MLDKKIPYFNVIMKRAGDLKLKNIGFPDGYSMTPYKDGDELYWAEIETSVNEFASNVDAIDYFKKDYMPHKTELYRRVYFLNDYECNKIGTISAWWSFKGDLKVPSIHWVAIKPGYQGKGLGRSMINFGIKKSLEIDGLKDNYLHTQTWSHKAINIYIKEGYEFVEDETFANFKNENKKAKQIFKEYKIKLVNYN